MIMVVLSYSWLEIFPSILLSSRVIRSKYIESRWSCIWSYDTSLGSDCIEMWPSDCLQHTEWESWVSHVFHILVSLPVCGIPEDPWPRLNCVYGTKPPGMAKLLRRNWGPGKSLFNGSFPWDHFRLFFVAGGGEGGGRKKRKDLSLKQIYCPLVTSLNYYTEISSF